jgi:hypothetical protein
MPSAIPLARPLCCRAQYAPARRERPRSRKITTDGSAKSLRKAGLARTRLRDDEGKRQYVYIKGNNGYAGLTLIASARPRHRALSGRGRRRLASGGPKLDPVPTSQPSRP